MLKKLIPAVLIAASIATGASAMSMPTFNDTVPTVWLPTPDATQSTRGEAGK